jgi:hypothetical protein
MSGSMFSVGRDCQVVVLGAYGRVDLVHVTGFESRQMTASVRVDRIDGLQLGAELPKGWEGTFDLERGNSAVEDFVGQLEAAYYNGQSPAPGTLYQYISEADGSTSTYQFNNVVFRLASAGLWKGDASVKQKLEFFASTRVRM